ncbi:Uncharacterised protein [Vibrio cholerae]|nr:Uncharacterised protein [Vibrio cholerae]
MLPQAKTEWSLAAPRVETRFSRFYPRGVAEPS